MTDAITFKDEHRPYVQTFTATRDGKILATNVRPAFKDEIERLRAQNAQLLAALRQYADPNNWGYHDEGGFPKGAGQYEDARFLGRKVALAAIAAVESEGE